jgi:hypothetical protein
MAPRICFLVVIRTRAQRLSQGMSASKYLQVEDQEVVVSVVASLPWLCCVHAVSLGLRFLPTFSGAGGKRHRRDQGMRVPKHLVFGEEITVPESSHGVWSQAPHSVLVKAT